MSQYGIFTKEELVAALNKHTDKVGGYFGDMDDPFEFPVENLLDDYQEVVGIAKSLFIILSQTEDAE